MGLQSDTEIKIIAEGVRTLHQEFDFQVSTSKELLKNQEIQTHIFENTRDDTKVNVRINSDRKVKEAIQILVF